MSQDENSADNVASTRSLNLEFEEGQFVERCLNIVYVNWNGYYDVNNLRKEFGDLFREMRGIKD